MAGTPDGGGGLLVGAAGRLQRHQTAQPMRMPGGGQIQLGVRGVHVGRPRRPVGHPGGSDRTEHGPQGALLTGFDPGVSHPGRVGDVLTARFLCGTQVQVGLEQGAGQFPGVHQQLVFDLTVGECQALGGPSPATTCPNSSHDGPNTPAGLSSWCAYSAIQAPHLYVSWLQTPDNVAAGSPPDDQAGHKAHGRGAVPRRGG